MHNSNFNVMDLLRITVELTYTRGEMDFPGIKITFGLDILQDWPAPKKIYDILIGFVQRNKLR